MVTLSTNPGQRVLFYLLLRQEYTIACVLSSKLHGWQGYFLLSFPCLLGVGAVGAKRVEKEIALLFRDFA
jgi:hypothetical protein